MTTAFQTIFDRAQNIAVSCRPVVAQTTTRTGVVKSVSRGGQIWRFDVKFPNGLPWTDLRPLITDMESADRYTATQVQLNNPGLNYIVGYQADSPTRSGFVVSSTAGATTLTITSAPSLTAGYLFRRGDFIQTGSTGRVYQVTADVPYNATSIPLNRPTRYTASNLNLLIGPDVFWNVYCTQFPGWYMMNHNQVAWNGNFQFSEVV